LLLVSSVLLVLAEQFRAGPAYIDRPGEVSVVVEFESPPWGIPKEAFRLVMDGNTITARDKKPFKDSDRGLALIICVDISKSISKQDLEYTKGALLSLLEEIEPEDKIEIFPFADVEKKIESSFARTRAQLAEVIDSLKPEGKRTTLYRTLYNWTLAVFR
jgi:Mg-chelatase subunit ChlD